MSLHIKPKSKPKIYEKVFLRTMLACLFAAGLIFIIILLYSNLGIPHKALAGPDYYTKQNGEWSQNALWATGSSNGTACNCNMGCNSNQSIFVHHIVVDSTCNPFKLSGGGRLYIQNPGKFTVLNGLEISSSQITIDPGDSLIVYGNVLLSGGSKIKVNGYLRINGNLTLTGNSTVDGTGSGIVTGTTTGTGWANVLPVTLISFQGTVVDEQIRLSWETASEINNHHFIVERSVNNHDFENLATVEGLGNSTSRKEYVLTDKRPLKGENYYRLKQVDNDGTTTTLKVMHLNFNGTNQNDVIVYPNPGKNNEPLFLISSSKVSNCIFHLYSSTGRLVFEKDKIELEKNIPFIVCQENKLEPYNCYLISITEGDRNIFSGKLLTTGN